jgi:hypothetical protein
MKISQKKIPLVSCPWYVKDWISKWSGLGYDDVTLEQLAETRPDNFVVDEKYFLENMEKIFRTMEQNGIKGMVIYVMHIYKFNNSVLERLDKFSEDKRVHVISMSYSIKTFRNIITHTFDFVEHALSHDINYIFSERLRTRRLSTQDFILMVNTKNEFRRSLCQALEQSDVLKNSMVTIGGTSNLKKISEKRKAIFDWIEQELPGNMCLDALRSWADGVPNFQAYEKSFCEIVVESANTGLDLTHDSPFSDLSEKTYRPIALGVPFVFLGAEKMYHKLIDDGYRLVDDGEFYTKWHSATNLQSAVSHLIIFLKKIIADKELRQNLESMASHNYKNFWVNRKLAHRVGNLNIIKECFGESAFDTIYDCFDF